MSVIAKEKLLNRLVLCQRELKRAKDAICFWSQELRLVVDAICDDGQFNFDEFLKSQEKKDGNL